MTRGPTRRVEVVQTSLAAAPVRRLPLAFSLAFAARTEFAQPYSNEHPAPRSVAQAGLFDRRGRPRSSGGGSAQERNAPHARPRA